MPEQNDGNTKYALKEGQVIKVINGELGEINTRLTTLEIQMTERWNHHDKRSDEIWGEIKNDISVLFDKITVIHKDHIDSIQNREIRKSNCMQELKGYTNKAVTWAVAIPGTIATIIGLIIVIWRLIQ